jgi:hypothetical protein
MFLFYGFVSTRSVRMKTKIELIQELHKWATSSDTKYSYHKMYVCSEHRKDNTDIMVYHPLSHKQCQIRVRSIEALLVNTSYDKNRHVLELYLAFNIDQVVLLVMGYDKKDCTLHFTPEEVGVYTFAVLQL